MALGEDDLLWANGQDNDGGIQSEILFAALDEIETFPAVEAAPTTFGGKKIIAGDFVMKSTKKFKKLYCTLETGSVVSTMVGERDAKSFENVLTGMFPGNGADVLGWVEYFKNTNMVFVVKELDGQMRVIGSEGLPATFETTESTTGTAVSDRKGVTWSVKSLGRSAPVITGAVPTTPAA